MALRYARQKEYESESSSSTIPKRSSSTSFSVTSRYLRGFTVALLFYLLTGSAEADGVKLGAPSVIIFPKLHATHAGSGVGRWSISKNEVIMTEQWAVLELPVMGCRDRCSETLTESERLPKKVYQITGS